MNYTEANLKETIVHRKYGLRMCVYETDYIYNHWHEEYEFVYVKAHPVNAFVNGEEITLLPGSVMLLQSRELHMMDSNYSANIIALVAHPSIWAGEYGVLFDGHLKFRRLFSPDVPDEKKIVDWFLEILRCYRAKEFGYQFRIQALLFGIFSHLIEQHMYSEQDLRCSENTIQSMLAFVHSSYAQELTLDRLSEHFHYSKSYIIRLFRKNTGFTPIAYVNRYRVEKAKHALKNGDKSIWEISIACGFQNIGYFHRTFKQYTGLAPGAYRKLSDHAR